MKMKAGTVKWFSLQKGFGYIHPDDGGPYIFVDIFAVECAGMRCLKESQRIAFEIFADQRTSRAIARSLAPLENESSRQDAQPSNPGASGSTPTLDGRFTTKNPFDSISDLISSALWARLRP
jgi:CspA family cold shock protein